MPIYTRLSGGGSLSVTLPLHFPNTSPCSTVFSIPRYLSSDSHSRGGLGEVLGKSFTNTSPLATPFCTVFPRDLGKWGGLFLFHTKKRGICWMSRRILFSKREMLLVHILCVTGIINDDGVFLYCVGIVPSVGVGHVTVFPSAKSWPTTR